ncbi:MAG: hypothetical protein KGL35_32460 [Bradyrhizobium sp.]|nr:hypothetical protein [Bradyrhizobium sp.]
MDWFRLYAEFATDPKVQMLSEAMQRRLVMLFCFRCQMGNVAETFHETEVETGLAFYMRISEAELAETKAVFLARGFIDDAWDVKNWNQRQYTSDSSTARVRDFRKRHKGDAKPRETFQKRFRNAPEQNRTEQIQNREEQKQEQPPAAPVARVETSKIPDAPDWVQPEAWGGFVAMRKRERHPLTPRAAALVIAELERLRAAGDDPNAVLDQSTRNGWRDVYAIKPNGTPNARGSPSRPSVAADFRKTRYEGTPDDQLPASLRPS